jgi:hypothetical protein
MHRAALGSWSRTSGTLAPTSPHPHERDARAYTAVKKDWLRGEELLRRGDRVKEAKEVLYVGDFERGEDTVVHANKSQGTAGFLVSDIGSDQSTDAGRVHVRHIGEIDDEVVRLIGANPCLEVEEIGDHQRPGETEDALAIRTDGVVDGKRLLAKRHRKILAPGSQQNIKGVLILRRIEGKKGSLPSGESAIGRDPRKMQRSVRKYETFHH